MRSMRNPLLAATLSLGGVIAVAVIATAASAAAPARTSAPSRTPAAAAAPTTRPAPATNVSRHPAIVHIVSRDRALTISSGPKGLLYSLAGEDGKVLVADASGEQFARLHPELYQSIRHYIAVESDARPATSSSADAGATAAIAPSDSLPVGEPLADIHAGF